MLCDLRVEKGAVEMVAHRSEGEGRVSVRGWCVMRRFD